MSELNVNKIDRSGFIGCGIFIEIIIAVALKMIYNAYQLNNWITRETNFSFSLAFENYFTMIVLVFSLVVMTFLVKKDTFKVLSISFVIILCAVFLILPKSSHDKVIVYNYEQLIENVKNNPEYRKKEFHKRSSYYPSSIDEKVYSRNKAYIELLDGAAKKDLEIYNKYAYTNAKYDLYIANPNQQRHLMTLLSLNNHKINELFNSYNQDHFISIGEYYKIVNKLLSEKVINKEQSDIYY